MIASQPPLCRYCGKPLAKATTTVYFNITTNQSPTFRGEKPRTLDEVRDLALGELVSVRWNRTKEDRYIWAASFWDGRSYVNTYFCKSEHAAQFGKLMAADGHATKSYCIAMTAQKAKAEEAS